MTDKTYSWDRTSIDNYLSIDEDTRDLLETFEPTREPDLFVLEVDL